MRPLWAKCGKDVRQHRPLSLRLEIRCRVFWFVVAVGPRKTLNAKCSPLGVFNVGSNNRSNERSVGYQLKRLIENDMLALILNFLLCRLIF